MTDWTAKSVRVALADAYRVLSATGGRVGHKRLKTAWPAHASDYPEPKTPMRRPSSIEISRMEIVLLGSSQMGPWLNGAIMGYPEHRDLLITSSMWQALRYSGREIADKLGMPESTYRSQRDFAAGIIARQLNNAGVKPWRLSPGSKR